MPQRGTKIKMFKIALYKDLISHFDMCRFTKEIEFLDYWDVHPVPLYSPWLFSETPVLNASTLSWGCLMLMTACLSSQMCFTLSSLKPFMSLTLHQPGFIIKIPPIRHPLLGFLNCSISLLNIDSIFSRDMKQFRKTNNWCRIAGLLINYEPRLI